MTTYERVSFREESGKRHTIYLQDPRTVGDLFTGIEVNREGDEIAPRGVDERHHIISVELVTKRTPMVMDKTYGELVEAGTCVCGAPMGSIECGLRAHLRGPKKAGSR